MISNARFIEVEEFLVGYFGPYPEPSPLESNDVLVEFADDDEVPPDDYADALDAYYIVDEGGPL